MRQLMDVQGHLLNDRSSAGSLWSCAIGELGIRSGEVGLEVGAATSPRPLRDDPRLGWEAKRTDYLPHFRSLTYSCNGGV